MVPFHGLRRFCSEVSHLIVAALFLSGPRIHAIIYLYSRLCQTGMPQINTHDDFLGDSGRINSPKCQRDVKEGAAAIHMPLKISHFSPSASGEATNRLWVSGSMRFSDTTFLAVRFGWR